MIDLLKLLLLPQEVNTLKIKACVDNKRPEARGNSLAYNM